jgi:hypothetical protein
MYIYVFICIFCRIGGNNESIENRNYNGSIILPIRRIFLDQQDRVGFDNLGVDDGYQWAGSAYGITGNKSHTFDAGHISQGDAGVSVVYMCIDRNCSYRKYHGYKKTDERRD